MRWRVLIAAAVAAALASSASAQPPQVGVVGAPQRPAFSPYLNLVRPGTSPTLNYYGLVRPEIQARQAIQNLQGSVTANQEALGVLQQGNLELPTTGHQAMFLNHGSYFMTGGAAPASGAGRSFGPAVSSGFNRAAPPRR